MKEIKSEKHSIWIGNGSLKKLDISNYSNVAILVDKNTKKYCLEYIEVEKPLIIEIKCGEKNKQIETCIKIWNELLSHNFDKNSVIINLGGGLIGDLGGFCASTYKRGIDFIQIPTSLLAMIDASIGGKTGVNFKKLKNQIGLFSFPKSVIIDPLFLKTLPNREFKSAFAEIVKYALVYDINLWDELQSFKFKIEEINNIIYKCVQIKNLIVSKDPNEKNIRKILNFGHTYGHAIESYYLNKNISILHGEAIFLGIILETEISRISINEKNKITNYIVKNFKLPEMPRKKDLIYFLDNDKKNINNKINFSLLKEIGKCTIDNLISKDEL